MEPFATRATSLPRALLTFACTVLAVLHAAGYASGTPRSTHPHPEPVVQPAPRSHLGFQWTAGIGLPGRLSLLDQRVSGTAVVSVAALQLRSALPRCGLFYQLGVEGFVARRAGRLDGRVRYRGRTARIGARAALGTQVGGGRAALLGGLHARTAVDLDQIEVRRRDNLRLGWHIAANYRLRPRLAATVEFDHALRYYDDATFLTDARRQVRLGVRYRFTS